MMFLLGVLNFEIVNFMVLSILGLFLIILAGLSLSFHTKTVLAALKDRKKCTGLAVETAILSTSVKRNDDYMIGRLNILRLSNYHHTTTGTSERMAGANTKLY